MQQKRISIERKKSSEITLLPLFIPSQESFSIKLSQLRSRENLLQFIIIISPWKIMVTPRWESFWTWSRLWPSPCKKEEWPFTVMPVNRFFMRCTWPNCILCNYHCFLNVWSCRSMCIHKLVYGNTAFFLNRGFQTNLI